MINSPHFGKLQLFFRKPSIYTGLLLIFGWLLPNMGLATHNLAGQITAEQNDPSNPNSYEITLTTYTDPAPAGVDRCSATIEVWSTGANPIIITAPELEEIPRQNGTTNYTPASDCNLMGTFSGVVVKGSVKRNIYKATFVFPGPGEYDLYYQDVARHGSVVNIDNPEEQAFFVTTRLFITPPIIGGNNTLLLLNEPLDDACIGKVWTHNPGGFDADGDSLVYSLRPSYQYDPSNNTGPIIATGYKWPDDPSFGNSTFVMDSITGLITWDVPTLEGIYNFGYKVEEYRNGRLLGYVVRDMAVWVIDCNNDPPVIETITDTCVQAGDLLEFEFLSWDPNDSDSLYFTLNNGSLGNNGPFSVPNAATIGGTVIDPVPGNSFPFLGVPVSTVNTSQLPVDTIKGTVRWQTECDNIRKQFFQVDFFANDNLSYSFNPSTTTLTAHKAVTIRVIPPPPLDLIVSKGTRPINLEWSPTICGDRVLGYNVYRRIGEPGWMQDTICCEMHPTDAGFSLINYNEGWLNTSYLDSLLDLSGEVDQNICYVVTAVYDDPIQPGIPALESCATAEACIEIEFEPIYLTNDSVSVTDPINGEIFVSWSEPDVDDFFPGPYTYRLYRANNNGFPAIRIATLNYGDTTFLDTGLDTESRGYNYRVEIYDALDLMIDANDSSHIGSSIYLTATGGGNNFIDLSWTEFVPWTNTTYEIFRSESGNPFVLVQTIAGTFGNTHDYRDENLNPEVEYCYFIRSFGSHGVPDIKDPLINDSQVACDFARDDEPPCAPDISARGDCQTLEQQIFITKSLLDCDKDADSITIWRAPTASGPFRPYLSLPYKSFLTDTTIFVSFADNPAGFAGCYAVTAIDTFGNISEISAPYCINFCPALLMSNVFSPNNDGINDILKPKFYRDVILKEFHIFDRWGRTMHVARSNIGKLWEGEIDGSNQMAKEGVYYYYLRYEELGINGNTPRELKGWVTLLR